MLVIKNPKRQPAKNAQTVQECCYIWSVFFLQTLPFQFVLAGTASLLCRELDSHLQGEWNLFAKFLSFHLRGQSAAAVTVRLRAVTSPATQTHHRLGQSSSFLLCCFPHISEYTRGSKELHILWKDT